MISCPAGGEMPPGPYLFDPDDLSDMPQRCWQLKSFGKTVSHLHQELPYQLTVETESWTEREDGSAEVRCTIYIMREGHRGIILGKGCDVGCIARLPGHLKLRLNVGCISQTHVKHSKDWMNDPSRYRDWN